MDESQDFNILEVNTLKTNKLDYSYYNNILKITKNNNKAIKLNSSHSDYFLITENSDLDIELELSRVTIGTKYKLLITNRQKRLKIKAYENDKFKGLCKINNNSNSVNNEVLKNNLSKKIVNKSTISDIIYIPNYKLGLYNGGYIDLVYIGDENNNIPKTKNDVGYWMVSGNLIGDINVPKSIVSTVSNTPKYLLTIYMLTNPSKILCATTTDLVTNSIYFNVVDNNNITIFIETSYTINIINAENDTVLYKTGASNNTHNIGICDNFLSNPGSENYIVVPNTFVDGLDGNSSYNIKKTYNTTVTDYNKLNVLKYKIVEGNNFNNNVKIENAFFNLIDVNSYNNNTTNTNSLPSLIMGKYNIFTDNKNKVGVGTSRILY